MTNIKITKKNETFITITGESYILQELHDRFSFYADGFKFHPSYKKKFWDGKIYLLKRKKPDTGEIYYGLLEDVIKYCKNHDYSYELDSHLAQSNAYSSKDLKQFLEDLKISAKGEQIQLRDYQEKGFIDSIQNKKQLLLSITSSGKSATIYTIMRFLNKMNLKGLIIVPNVSLIHQLFNDFDDYSTINEWSVQDNIHKIFSGQDKVSSKNVFLSTFQSLMNIKDNSYFNFDYVIIDECLDPNTPIKLSDGSSKPIKDINVNDIVMTLNDDKLEPNKVIKVHKNISNEQMYIITVDDKKLHITGNHKIYTKRGWIRTDHVTINDHIFVFNLEWKQISNIEYIDHNHDTYNLHVENNHNYFANDILVSNCHTVKGKELSNILEKCVNAEYRIGLTGTLDNCKANINVITGLTGQINKLNTTKQLIERKEVSDFNIKCLVLKYDEDTRKLLKKYKYQDEIKYLVSNEKRNHFIKNLAISMKSNTIILFNYVSHGKLLYEMIKGSKHLNGRNVYFISGEVDGLERERIRNIIESESNAIILGTSSIMSTGISIRNLHNIIFCIGTKSSIRLLQSIGRVLRLHSSKDKACIYDIVDDLSYKNHKNFSLLHFLERIKIYNNEQFNYKLLNVEFNPN